VVNRGVERGLSMTADLRRSGECAVHLEQWRGVYVPSDSIDVLVNATSIGLFPDVEAMPDVDLSCLSRNTVVCDAVFNPPETPLLRAARRCGLATLDGLSMLVYQGVIGFELWTGEAAPEAIMKHALRRALIGSAEGA
jgi:shikimate dehydrogenase